VATPDEHLRRVIGNVKLNAIAVELDLMDPGAARLLAAEIRGQGRRNEAGKQRRLARPLAILDARNTSRSPGNTRPDGGIGVSAWRRRWPRPRSSMAVRGSAPNKKFNAARMIVAPWIAPGSKGQLTAFQPETVRDERFSRLPPARRRKMDLDTFTGELLAHSWDQKIAADIVAELRARGEQVGEIEEVRRFLAAKGFRDLLARIKLHHKNDGPEGLKEAARAMRIFALERPGLSVASFRTLTSDSPEWRQAAAELRTFMMGLFASCGIYGDVAENALRMLRSLVRGFALHEMTDSFIDPQGYSASYEFALDVFVAGIAEMRRQATRKRTMGVPAPDDLVELLKAG
jgi:hypothetical protein